MGKSRKKNIYHGVTETRRKIATSDHRTTWFADRRSPDHPILALCLRGRFCRKLERLRHPPEFLAVRPSYLGLCPPALEVEEEPDDTDPPEEDDPPEDDPPPDECELPADDPPEYEDEPPDECPPLDDPL